MLFPQNHPYAADGEERLCGEVSGHDQKGAEREGHFAEDAHGQAGVGEGEEEGAGKEEPPGRTAAAGHAQHARQSTENEEGQCDGIDTHGCQEGAVDADGPHGEEHHGGHHHQRNDPLPNRQSFP